MQKAASLGVAFWWVWIQTKLSSLKWQFHADAVGDVLSGLLKADFRGIPDAVGDVLTGLNRFADFHSSPDITGSNVDARGLARYFPDLRAPVEPPQGRDFIATSLRNVQVSAASIRKGQSAHLELRPFFWLNQQPYGGLSLHPVKPSISTSCHIVICRLQSLCPSALDKNTLTRWTLGLRMSLCISREQL